MWKSAIKQLVVDCFIDNYDNVAKYSAGAIKMDKN